MVVLPAGLLHAVQEHDVDVVDAQLEAIALEVALGVGELGGVGLGLDHVVLAGDALEGLAEIDVRAVLVGHVEEADAVVQGVADDPGEPLMPSRVWLLAWPEPTLPVPMPTSETWMPVLPRVTLSAGPLGRAERSRPAGRRGRRTSCRRPAATVAAAVACAMKSRRFSGGVMRIGLPSMPVVDRLAIVGAESRQRVRLAMRERTTAGDCARF